MGKDKVAKPVNKDRSGGIKQVKSSIIEGPTATSGNLNPFNRKK
uniref:Uncharacterized protein n=1 Tax=viral metagenome TaxID=1070528 RepID=A0A6M3IM64_9ZZZZ